MAEEKKEKALQDKELNDVNGGTSIHDYPKCPKCGHLVTAWTTLTGCHKHKVVWRCDHCYYQWPKTTD